MQRLMLVTATFYSRGFVNDLCKETLQTRELKLDFIVCPVPRFLALDVILKFCPKPIIKK